ncbi:MAG: hypothetical protein KF745_09385 [Phycisphaeraceae bacterium]|nr:hypothetical protein [Phycisphaeraceae bacterium]
MSRRPAIAHARFAAGTLGLVGFAMVLGACESEANKQAKLIRENLTPELATLYQRPVDVENRLTIVGNENMRMCAEDLGRVFLLDRPSSLKPEPGLYPR